MKRTLILGSLVAALAAGLLWLLIENRQLRTQLAERPAQTPTSQTAPPAPSPAPASVATAPPAAPEPTARAQPPPARPPASTRWNDPQWRATQFNQAYLQAEVRYSRFFQRLKHWPPERLEALKRQFAEQDLALQQAAMQGAESGGAPADLSRLHSDQEEQLKATLSVDEFRDFQETEAMETSQQAVSSVFNTMRSRGVTLDPAQEEAVLRTYANTLRDAATRAATTPIAGLDSSQLAELKRQQIQALNAALLKQMSAVLDEAQLKSFMEAQLEQQGGG